MFDHAICANTDMIRIASDSFTFPGSVLNAWDRSPFRTRKRSLLCFRLAYKDSFRLLHIATMASVYSGLLHIRWDVLG